MPKNDTSEGFRRDLVNSMIIDETYGYCLVNNKLKSQVLVLSVFPIFLNEHQASIRN